MAEWLSMVPIFMLKISNECLLCPYVLLKKKKSALDSHLNLKSFYTIKATSNILLQMEESRTDMNAPYIQGFYIV